MKQNKLIPKESQKASLPGRNLLYSEDGVDVSLIRWMLSLTPTERLQTLQQNIHSLMKLRSEKTDS